MKPWLAINARNLLEHRQQGWTVDGPVVVSLVGGEFTETALYVKPDMPVEAMDWRMLVNLDVWLWASAKTFLDRVLATAWRIAQVRPKQLNLRFEHQGQIHEIDVGTGWHTQGHEAHGLPANHRFFWVPMDVGWTVVGHRIVKALRATYPKQVWI